MTWLLLRLQHEPSLKCSRKMMEEDATRKALESYMGEPVTDREWAYLKAEGNAGEIEHLLAEDEWAFEEALPDAACKVESLRTHVLGPEHAQEKPRMLSRTPRAELPGRDRALSLLLAQEAAEDQEVVVFRSSALEGRLLAWEEVADWMKAQVAADGPPTTYLRVPLGPGSKVRPTTTGLVVEPPLSLDEVPFGAYELGVEVLSYGTPDSEWAFRVPVAIGGTLDDLRRLSAGLARRFGWQEAEASVFVLTGLAPLVADVRVRTEINFHHPSVSRLVLIVDPTVTPRRLSTLYAQIRRRLVTSRTRMQTGKHLHLAVFAAEERARDKSWDEVMRAWNTEWAPRFKRGRYEYIDNFIRDAGKARERLSRSVLGLGSMPAPQSASQPQDDAADLEA